MLLGGDRNRNWIGSRGARIGITGVPFWPSSTETGKDCVPRICNLITSTSQRTWRDMALFIVPFRYSGCGPMEGHLTANFIAQGSTVQVPTVQYVLRDCYIRDEWENRPIRQKNSPNGGMPLVRSCTYIAEDSTQEVVEITKISHYATQTLHIPL